MPERLHIKSLIQDLNFPLFVKPVQLFGSMNLKKIDNCDALLQWANSVCESDYFEIDEFIEGTMYHCDSYIKDEKILFTLVSQNSRPCYDFTQGMIKGTIVLPVDHADSVMLSDIAKQTLSALGMPKSGVTHMEVIKTKENQIYFVEVAHRSPGCLIPKMYMEHAGIDTLTSHFLLQIDPHYKPKLTHNTYAAWACYPKIPGQVVSLKKISDTLDSSCEVEWHVNVGDIIMTYSEYGRDYIGTVFMKNSNFNQLYEDFITVNNNNLCEIKPA